MLDVTALGTTNKLQDKLSLPPVWFNIQQLTSYEYDDPFCHLIGALKFEGGLAPCGKKILCEKQDFSLEPKLLTSPHIFAEIIQSYEAWV